MYIVTCIVIYIYIHIWRNNIYIYLHLSSNIYIYGTPPKKNYRFKTLTGICSFFVYLQALPMNFKIVKKYITIDQQILNKMKKREKKQNQRTNNILRLFGEDPIQKTRKQKKWKTPPKKTHTIFQRSWT